MIATASGQRCTATWSSGRIERIHDARRTLCLTLHINNIIKSYVFMYSFINWVLKIEYNIFPHIN